MVGNVNEREVLSHRSLILAYEEICQLEVMMKMVSKIDEKLLGNLVGTGFRERVIYLNTFSTSNHV